MPPSCAWRWAAVLSAAAAVGLATTVSAGAAWLPSQTAELIAASAPGGGLDRVARAIQRAAARSRAIEVSFLVVNRPGGNYSVAWHYLNEQAGDGGHHLLVGSLGLLANRIGGTSSVPIAALVPIARLYSEYVVLSVRADSPLASGRDLAQQLALQPDALAIGLGGGPRGVNYLATAAALHAAGAAPHRLRLVALTSSAAAMAAVLGGHVDAAATPVSVALPHLKAARTRILAISAPRRQPGALAGVPTWQEQGIDSEFANFRMVLAPRGMRADQVTYWEQAFWRLTRTAAWQRELETNHWDDAFLGSAASGDFLHRERVRLEMLFSALKARRPAGGDRDTPGE